MNWDLKKMWPAAAMSVVGLTTALGAAQDKNKCPMRSFCGPDREINPSVRPFTSDPCCCDDGEFNIIVAGFYWKPTQDGMAYGVDNNVTPEGAGLIQQTTLVNADYLEPNFKWDLGFKVGVGYNSTHDGWDIQALWTHFHGHASSHDEADAGENHALIPFWSAFSPTLSGAASFGTLIATDIDTHWSLKLDIADFELGREFWTSRFLSIRPFIGIRAAWIRQDWDLKFKGGTWDSNANGFNATDLNGEADLDNDFKGVGVRGGLDTYWNFTCMGCGCGSWGFFGSFAMSILYGRFSVDHDESFKLAASPFTKTKILEADDHFHSSRAITDLILGIQWSTLFHDNEYGFSLGLAWEHHMFFDQNQMWRVMRVGDVGTPLANPGENVYIQSRGDLATQGWTLTAKFTF